MATDVAPGGTVLFERDEPRFVGGLLLGAASLDTEERAEIQAYLGAVARQRRLPLHPAVAWNALYFGWDLERAEYDSRAICVDGFSDLGMASESAALPVGAFTWLTSPGGTRLWAEIVYKEGRDAAVDDFGEVAAEDSGRRGRLDDANRCHRRELLVPDTTVFGQDAGLALTEARFRRRGRLTSAGHILVDAVYDPADRAQESDLSQYAKWLWLAARDELFAGSIGFYLGEGASEEQIWDGLSASLAAASDLLATAMQFRRVGDYYVLGEAVAERLRRQDALGGGDVEDLRASLHGRRGMGPIVYTSLLPLLEERARGDGGDSALNGTRYPASVVEVSATIAEGAGENADGVDLRLDDGSESGGIWRTERIEPGWTCPLSGRDPALPLHLGVAGDALHLATHVPPAAVTSSIPVLADPLDEWEVDETHLAWVWALRPRDLELGTVRLPVEVKSVLCAEQGQVSLHLRHLGDIAEHQRSQQVRLSADRDWVTGISWPPLLRGVRIYAWVARDSAKIEAATRRLDQPVDCAGETYWFAFDRAIAEGRGGPVATATILLSLLAVNLIRRQGHPSDDGRSRSLSLGEVSVLLGHVEADIRLIRRALDEAVDEGRLRRDADGVVYRWTARRAAMRPAPDHDPWLDEVRDPGEEVRDGVSPRRHWVAPFTRRLPLGQVASNQQREEYRRYVADLGRRGLSTELPLGRTFVAAHKRGGRFGD